MKTVLSLLLCKAAVVGIGGRGDIGAMLERFIAMPTAAALCAGTDLESASRQGIELQALQVRFYSQPTESV